jgi:hypothetical protein
MSRIKGRNNMMLYDQDKTAEGERTPKEGDGNDAGECYEGNKRSMNPSRGGKGGLGGKTHAQ